MALSPDRICELSDKEIQETNFLEEKIDFNLRVSFAPNLIEYSGRVVLEYTGSNSGLVKKLSFAQLNYLEKKYLQSGWKTARIKFINEVRDIDRTAQFVYDFKFEKFGK
jgi:hypothetical protein